MKYLVGFVLAFLLQTGAVPTASAQEDMVIDQIATSSAVATDAAVISTPSAQPELPRLPFIPTSGTNSNITQSSGEAVDRLEALLVDQDLGPVQPFTVLQHAIRRAVSQGIPATTIAFILLFPVIASLIAFARHILGFSGLSMYAPAALAVALLSLGILPGSILFVTILLLATIGKTLLMRLKLPYLPRTAMVLWGVSLGTFGLLIASTYIPLVSLPVVNVFALLIMMLLSENFLEIQASLSPSVAIQRVLETFVLGLMCALVLGSEAVQAMVILFPEATLAVIAALNIIIGRYLGLRLAEWLRFRSIIESEE